jgi:hypothetical protein
MDPIIVSRSLTATYILYKANNHISASSQLISYPKSKLVLPDIYPLFPYPWPFLGAPPRPPCSFPPSVSDAAFCLCHIHLTLRLHCSPSPNFGSWASQMRWPRRLRLYRQVHNANLLWKTKDITHGRLQIYK